MVPIDKQVELKYNKYLAKCSERGLLFKPFVIGSLGGFCEEAEEIIKYLGKSLAIVESQHPSVTIARVRQRISFAVQKAQSVAWTRRGEAGDLFID